MESATQNYREAAVTTVLADDVLLFCGMRGREELGRPFEFELSLLSSNLNISAKEMLGTEMSITLVADGGHREFNGVVSRFTVMDQMLNNTEDPMMRYGATLRPHFWLLTRTSHCRFFYNSTVLEVVTQVLDGCNVNCRNECIASYPKLEHCSQYRETDFDFVSRLLEREGVYYYFEHTGGKDLLVLTDSPTAHRPISNYGTIEFQSWRSGDSLPAESIYRWESSEEIAAGKSEFNSFDFKNVRLCENQGLLSRAMLPEGEQAYVREEYEPIYEVQSDGQRYAQIRIESHQANKSVVEAATTARGMWPGGLFSLNGHPRQDQNGDYLVTAATYALEFDNYLPTVSAREAPPPFDCRFQAIPKSRAFRPQRVTPRPHAGMQTALVMAPDEDEIATDSYGRVKVQFHWEQFDPPSAANRMQRCWVRISQNWAGRNWGAMFMPRAGQEVIVAFLDGDADYPLVLGCVYNSTNQPPYTLPTHGAVSTIRTSSISNDGERSELRFNDKDLQVLLYTDGRYDNYVKQNRYAWTGEDEHSIVQGRRLIKADSHHLTVNGGQNIKVGTSASLSADADIVYQARENYLMSGESVHIKGNGNVVIEAEVMLTLKAGGSFVTIDPEGVQISGMVVGLNSGGAAGAAPGGSPTSPTEPEKADDGSSVT